MKRKACVSWWLKILVKMVLNRLPVPYRFWKRIGVFKHGEMEQGAYSLKVFRQHYAHWAARKNYTILELGPGDSASTALIAHAYFAARVFLVDSGDWANREIGTYHKVAAYLASQGLTTPAFATFKGMLEACGATYLHEGLASLRAIPDGSVDCIFSQAVLEHIRLDAFQETAAHLRRILRTGGIMTHRVDLKDHLAESLNSLRFSHRSWESPIMAESGFYTNRIRMGRMVKIMEEAGFKVEVTETDRWPELPVPRGRLAEPFRTLPEQELLVSGFFMCCRHSV